MNQQEKILYHQIHPAKLFVDWSTGMLALFFLWQHSLIGALIIMFIPPGFQSIPSLTTLSNLGTRLTGL